MTARDGTARDGRVMAAWRTRWGRRWRAWAALCNQREPALALALFRIAVGTVLAGTLLSVVFEGTVEALWVDAAHGGIFPSPRRTVLVDLLGGPTPPVVWGLVWTAVAAAFCTAVGAFGRLSPLVAVQAYAALYPTSINASSDWLIANGLWLLVLADATATLSVDAKLRHGRFVRDDVTVMAWPRYLAIFQLVCVYAFAGFEKIGEGWTFAEGYTAIYNVLQRPDRARFELGFLPSLYPVTQAMTFVSVYWEMSAPLLLLFYYYRATPARGGRLRSFVLRHDVRLWFLAFGVLFHLGIAATLHVGPFSYIALSFYFCFLHPDELRALWRRALRRFPNAPHGATG